MIRKFLTFAVLFAIACGPDITTNRDASVPMPKSPSWAWGARDTISHYELAPAAQNPTLHLRIQQEWMRSSVYDQATFVLPKYSKWAPPEEGSAAARLIEHLSVLSGRR